MGDNIKQDVNFLEYPLHVVDYQGMQQVLEIHTDRGAFRLISGANDRLPSSEDRVILYHFLKKLMASDYTENVIETTRYQVCKGIWNAQGKRYYDMVVKALKRYTKLSAEFENVFYENRHYQTKIFHIIETTVIEDGRLTVTFSPSFIQHMRESKFYRMINYEEIKTLRSNTSIRLYEYLIKQPLPFMIGVVKLGEKLTFPKKDQFPSTILRRVNPAIEEINKKTSLKIAMKFDQKTKVCRFTAMRMNQAATGPAVIDAPFELLDDTPNFEMLDALTPEAYTALEESAAKRLRDAGHFMNGGERTKQMIREEMLRLKVESEVTAKVTA